MDKAGRIKELVVLLNEASKAYYNGDNIIMTDFEFDRLYDELVSLESETGVVLDGSPTQNVGYGVVDSLQKVPHGTKMLSLDKTKEVERLQSFLGDMQAVLSLKLDGLTVVARYEDGELVQAVTRGNGEVGEDITHNALVFNNLPKKIEYKERLMVRGEAVISFTEFERINSEMGEDTQYKNPRNLTSGTVRQLDSRICAKRKVDFFALAIITGGEFSLKSESLGWLAQQGFAVVEHSIVDENSVEDMVMEFKNKAVNGNYATDGLVLTFDDIEYSDGLGATSKFPRDSIAFKWADETAETVLREIEWSVSRTGLINPIAIFEPVDIEGTTVERASLHNVSIVEELELGFGDRITVYKANMIIPQVAENLTRSGMTTPPEICPVCGAQTEMQVVGAVKTLYCMNIGCAAQVVRGITHYVSRDALNIEGLSIQTVERFVEVGFLKDFTDIYQLETFENEIKAMHGFGEKSYNALIKAIEKSKTVKLANFIYGLGINHVGLAGAKLLCEHMEDDFTRIKLAEKDELLGIAGFGEAIAESIVQYFSGEGAVAAEKALSYLAIVKQERAMGGKFEGKTFVITGDTAMFKNRAEMAEYITQNGGKVTSSVSTKTDYLVNNDTTSNSSKNKKAKELGVEIIGEAALVSDKFGV